MKPIEKRTYVRPVLKSLGTAAEVTLHNLSNNMNDSLSGSGTKT